MLLVNTRGAPADKPHNHGNCTHIAIVVMLYLTFVFFLHNLQFAIWGQEISHVKVRTYATKLCVNFYTVCYILPSVKQFFSNSNWKILRLARFLHNQRLWQISGMGNAGAALSCQIVRTWPNWAPCEGKACGPAVGSSWMMTFLKSPDSKAWQTELHNLIILDDKIAIWSSDNWMIFS